MITKVAAFIVLSLLLAITSVSADQSVPFASLSKNPYEFDFKSIDGKPFRLAQHQGKVLLIVNTATECGLAGQFQLLEKLHQKYKDRGLIVIGVPSDDFGNQEPRKEEDIVKYTRDTFGVTFPLTEKTIVSGAAAHPFYIWAAEQKKGGFLNTAPRWNFHKYLVGRDGKLLDSFASTTSPLDQDLVQSIENALGDNVPFERTE
jgi:glutathione peroxidase